MGLYFIHLAQLANLKRYDSDGLAVSATTKLPKSHAIIGSVPLVLAGPSPPVTLESNIFLTLLTDERGGVSFSLVCSSAGPSSRPTEAEGVLQISEEPSGFQASKCVFLLLRLHVWLLGGACIDFLWIVASFPKQAHHVGLSGFCHLPYDTRDSVVSVVSLSLLILMRHQRAKVLWD